jgi:UDP-N-acetylmuramate--alanine ligase
VKIHLMGVCGSGMSALAAWYASQGHRVTGCDSAVDAGKKASLEAIGIEVFEGHSTDHLQGADKLVFSAAIPQGNSELLAAASAGIIVMRRSEALADLARDYEVVAVAGAHGKTTTTSMAGWIAEQTGLDPTVFVGGHVSRWNGNFRPGGRLAFIESDEYDRTFLRLSPTHAAVTSFALEHLECYGSPEALEWAFQVFLESVLPGGTVIVPVEKPALGYWAERIGRKVLRSGPGGEIDAKIIEYSGWGERFRLYGHLGFIPSPGQHNVRNAQVAVALAVASGADSKAAVESLSTWPGVRRRLEMIGRYGKTSVVSDYAHHPDEMAAALTSVRKSVKGTVTVVFQPHLYSRTALLYREMGAALSIADRSYVLPVFAAREAPVPGVSSQLVVNAALQAGANASVADPCQITEIFSSLSEGVLIFMGAGSVDGMGRAALREVTE